MPGSNPVQIRLISSKVHALLLQKIERKGFKSFPPRPAVAVTSARTGSGLTMPSFAQAANLAREGAACAERGRCTKWLGTSLQRTNTDLLARLPLGDAVKLAALVGTGQITWPEVNAALDAKIKMATARELNRQGQEFDMRPLSRQQSDEVCGAHDKWEETRRCCEREIWARYHANCDQLFANDPAPLDTATWSPEQLRSRERILDRLRSARDRELAMLNRQQGAQSPWPVPSAIGIRTQLTLTESDASRRLDETGFVDSAAMIKAIHDLAIEIAEGQSNVSCGCRRP